MRIASLVSSLLMAGIFLTAPPLAVRQASAIDSFTGYHGFQQVLADKDEDKDKDKEKKCPTKPCPKDD